MYKALDDIWGEQTAAGQMFEVNTIDVRGVPTLSFAHAPPSLREFWLSTAAYGDREYLIYQDERYTYTQAHQYVASIANWLKLQGIQPGDRVAIAMRNYPEWMLAYWATTSMGAVVVGINAWWIAQELHHALNDSTPKLMICDKERLARFNEISSDFPDMQIAVVRLEGSAPDGITLWEEVLATDPLLPDVSIDPDSDACIFYTSGTTGKAKGAQLTHRGCVVNVMNLAFMKSVLAAATARSKGEEAPVADPNSQLCYLVATPMFHVTANNCAAHITTMVGGKLIHMYKWDAADALRIIEEEQVTTFNAVPMMSREMLLHPDFAARDTGSLLNISGGGAPMQPDLIEKLEEGTENARAGTGYGMTETCGLIAGISGDFFVDRPTSVGRAMPTFEVQVVGSEGTPLAAGERGEIWVRGATVIKGYLNHPDAIVDGWLKTGDVGYIDEEGFIYLVDRIKEMVLRGGENVYCSEVENAIFSHYSVAECVVLAIPDDRLGEEVGAALYLKKGASLDAATLRTHCKDLLSSYKIPRYIWFVSQPLPRNAAGKFVKRQVLETLDIAEAG